MPPRLILVNEMPAELDLLTEALTLRAGRKVEILSPQRGDKRKPVEHAMANAKEALARRMAESASQAKLMLEMAEIFDLDAPPKRIEVYDNSHISGTNAYGCMIVAGPDGLMKNQYRKFSIKPANEEAGEAPIEPGDDYAMMRQVLTRRFTRALKEDPDDTHATWPDLVLIDGGQGQLSVTMEVFAELGIDDVAVAAIAKGPDRNAGRERFFMPGREPFGW